MYFSMRLSCNLGVLLVAIISHTCLGKKIYTIQDMHVGDLRALVLVNQKTGKQLASHTILNLLS